MLVQEVPLGREALLGQEVPLGREVLLGQEVLLAKVGLAGQEEPLAPAVRGWAVRVVAVVAPAAAGRAPQVLAVRAPQAVPEQAPAAAAVVELAVRAPEAVPEQARAAAAAVQLAVQAPEAAPEQALAAAVVRALEAVPEQAPAAAVVELAVAVLELAAAVWGLAEQRAPLALEPVARAPGEAVVERAQQVGAQRRRRIPAAVVASVSARASGARGRCCSAASSRSRCAAAVHVQKHESLGSVPILAPGIGLRFKHPPCGRTRLRISGDRESSENQVKSGLVESVRVQACSRPVEKCMSSSVTCRFLAMIERQRRSKNRCLIGRRRPIYLPSLVAHGSVGRGVGAAVSVGTVGCAIVVGSSVA